MSLKRVFVSLGGVGIIKIRGRVLAMVSLSECSLASSTISWNKIINWKTYEIFYERTWKANS